MKTWWQREVDWTRMQRDPMPSPYRKLWATRVLLYCSLSINVILVLFLIGLLRSL